MKRAKETQRITRADLDRMVAAGTIRGYVDKGLVDPPKKAGRAKFGNEKVEWNGETFDSKKEYREYRKLLLLQKAGIIAALKRQERFLLIEKNETERKCEYLADFTFILCENGKKHVLDVKSDATRSLSTYIMKRKLMKDRYNIEIQEV